MVYMADTKIKKKGKKEFEVMAKAVAGYIKSMGGTAVVVGGVSVGEDFGSRKYNYFIQIAITGMKPTEKNI